VDNKRVEEIMTTPFSSPLSPANKALLLTAAICALAAPAAAQQAAAPSSPADVNKQTRSFVQAYAARSGKIDQLPRWHQPLCVAVRGLVPAESAKVAARIEDVAKAVGLKVLPAGCSTNIQVMFADDPQLTVNTAHEAYLGYHYKADLKKIRTVSRPIQGWYATATLSSAGANGLAFAGDSKQPTAGGMAAPGGPDSASASPDFQSNFGLIGGMTLSMDAVDGPDRSPPAGCADSRFSSCLTSAFMNVMIVVDNHAVTGKDLGVMTDYIAMLALSQPKSLDGCNVLPSVIDMFAPACPGRAAPTGLTPADSSYLTAVYATDPEAKATSAQGDIAGRMAKILIKAQVATR
jgi:hypothetical protein